MFSKLPYFYMFLVVTGFGTFLSISSLHWLGIWIGLEMNLIGFLPILVYKKSSLEIESGIKYFTIQAMGSSLLLFGSLLLFSMTYTWDLLYNSQLLSSKEMNSELMAMTFILSGLLLKLGMFPFHYWLPSVMAGVSWFSCLMLTTWQKLAPLFLISSLLYQHKNSWILLILSVMSALSSIIGGIGGLNQTQVRALLAYSSISHLGWIMFACIHSSSLMKIYLTIYITISIILFLSLLHSDPKTMESLMDLSNWKSSRIIAMLTLLSLGGLPPLLGFVSKWLVIYYALMGPFKLFILPLILGSLLSLYYYLSLFFSFFISESKKFSMSLSYKNSNMLLYSSSIFIIMNLMSILLIFKYDLLYYII